MKRLLFLLALPVLSYTASAQVGISNTDPKASLDITASNVSTPSNTDGILVPRVDNFPVTDPGPDQDGMLVFATGSGTPTKGFYYWNNATTTWTSFGGTDTRNTLDGAYDEGGSGAGRAITADNGALEIQGNGGLRVEDDILAGDQIIHDGDGDTFVQFSDDGFQLDAGGRNYIDVQHTNQEIVFNEDSAASDLRVESDNQTHMLFVDGSNNAIGIGRNNPRSPIHVGIQTTFDLSYENTGQDGLFLRGSGNNSGVNTVGSSIGFGPPHTARSTQRKAAIAAIQTSGDVDHVGLSFYVHSSGVNLSDMVEGMRLTHQGRLGLGFGNTAPDATLDVDGTIQYTDGNEAAGYILSSDSNGNASWADPATLLADTDDQTIDEFSLTGTTLNLSLEDDGMATQTVDLSSLVEDNDWTEVGADLERQVGDVYIGDTAGTDNDLVISDRVIDWDNTSYFLNPDEDSRLDGIVLDDGLASAPSLVFQGDSNSGLYQAETNSVSFGASGSERIRLSPSGQIEFYNSGRSVFIGESAGENDTRSFTDNVFVGYQAGMSNTSGTDNTYVGTNAGSSNSTGNYNVGIGEGALAANSTGLTNVAVGRNALASNTSGRYNIGVGHGTLQANTTTYYDIAIGYNNLFNKTSGDSNVSIGAGAGLKDVTSNRNVYIGYNAGGGLGTGPDENKEGNVFIGYQAGFNESNNNRLYIENSNSATPLVFGDFSTNEVGINWNSGTALPNTLSVNGDASKNAAGAWLANSDRRLKKDIQTIAGRDALEKISKLRGVTYLWNDNQTGIDRPKGIQYGFIAQELMEVFPEKVTRDGQGFYQTAYGDYDALFVQAFKELASEINTLKSENESLKEQLSQFQELEARLEVLESKLNFSSPPNGVSVIKE